jgi:DNA-binding beta-propeller fold protein YncE
VSDAHEGSVFVLGGSLEPVGELKGIGVPLGVAVAADGAICAGSRARRAVLCFSRSGTPTRTLGEGALEMPNDLAFDRAGNLYVADSTANRIRVFGKDGALVRTVGSGGATGALAFPSAVAIAYPPAHPEGELYVADQRNGRVAVFELGGAFRRALGQPASAFGSEWQGRFARLQALAVDALGRVHALDSYQSLVQVLDGETGSFVESYGTFGSGAGELSVPLGIVILRDGRVVVANSENRRLELMRTLVPGNGG